MEAVLSQFMNYHDEDVINMICNMKNEMEVSEKYEKCLDEIKSIKYECDCYESITYFGNEYVCRGVYYTERMLYKKDGYEIDNGGLLICFYNGCEKVKLEDEEVERILNEFFTIDDEKWIEPTS